MAAFDWQPPASISGSQWLSPEHVYSQPANMQDLIRAFPRLRHTRVMKPRSAGNSPSSASKLRTMLAQSHVMHDLSSQADQASLEAALLASAMRARNSRPVSWHPSSARDRGLSNPQCTPDLETMSYTGTDTVPDQTLLSMSVYSGENMVSYPMGIDSMFSPQEYMPVFPDMQEQDSLPLPHQTPSLPMAGSTCEPMAWDANATTASLSTIPQAVSDGWSLDMWAMDPGMPPPETACPSYASVPSSSELSGPSTPDFLPIQQFDDEPEFRTEMEKGGEPEEELVGMGLYSQPDRFVEQTLQGTLGKGLKLEETFTPSEDQEEGEQEETPNMDEEGSAQEEVISPQITEPESTPRQSTFSAPKQSSKQALNLLHKSFFFDTDDTDQQALTAAQTFSNISQSCMSYGYGWI